MRVETFTVAVLISACAEDSADFNQDRIEKVAAECKATDADGGAAASAACHHRLRRLYKQQQTEEDREQKERGITCVALPIGNATVMQCK